MVIMNQSLILGIGNEVIVVFCAFFLIAFGALCSFRFGYFRSAIQATPETSSSSEIVAPRQTYNNETCPICLGPLHLAVETNCGHKFCGECLKQYIENRGPDAIFLITGPLPCPMCRQRVNLLLPSFLPEEPQPERNEIEEAIRRFNIRFGNEPRSIWDYIRDCPVLVRHMIFAPEGLHRLHRLRITMCLIVFTLYFLMPVDLLPEAFLGLFGLFDDLMVLILCAVYVSTIYRGYILQGGTD